MVDRCGCVHLLLESSEESSCSESLIAAYQTCPLMEVSRSMGYFPSMSSPTVSNTNHESGLCIKVFTQLGSLSKQEMLNRSGAIR